RRIIALTASASTTAAIGGPTARPTRLASLVAKGEARKISFNPLPRRRATSFGEPSSLVERLDLAGDDLRLHAIDIGAHVLRHGALSLVVVIELHHVGVLESEGDVAGRQQGAILDSADDPLDAGRVVGEIRAEHVVGRARRDVGEDAESANVRARLAGRLDDPHAGG